MGTIRCSGRRGGVSTKGVSAQEGVCLGGVCPGGSAQGGSAPVQAGIHPLPCEQNDRRLWKHNLAATALRTVTSPFHTYLALSWDELPM